MSAPKSTLVSFGAWLPIAFVVWLGGCVGEPLPPALDGGGTDGGMLDAGPCGGGECEPTCSSLMTSGACPAHRVCETTTAGPVCREACEAGFELDPATGACTACANVDCAHETCDEGSEDSIAADCAAQNRACDEDADVGRCGACLESFRVDEESGACVPDTLCGGRECTEDEMPVRDGASCTCEPRACLEGEAERPDGTCRSCSIACSSEGETGLPYPKTDENGACVCATEPGHFWSPGDAGRARPCDEDGDGWMSHSAFAAWNAYDSTVREIARGSCELSEVDGVVLANEYGQEQIVFSCAEGLRTQCTGPILPLPLVEPDRNDSDTKLAQAGDAAPAYGGGEEGRSLAAVELNAVTKACVSLLADLDADGVRDVVQAQSTVSSSLLDRWGAFAHFMELHETSFREPIELDAFGRLVIRERSRCDASFPLAYAPEDGTYWVQCARRRDARFDRDAPRPGFDFAAWSCDGRRGSCLVPNPPVAPAPGAFDPPPHGLCDLDGVWDEAWRGMHHHSQFQCVLVGDEPEVHVAPIGAFEGEAATLRFQQCRATEPSTVACEARAAEPGAVGFAARLYTASSADVMGCVDESIWTGLCPGDSAATPVYKRGDEADFGRLVCACGFSPTSSWCDDVCLDLWTDQENCGACGHACAATEICVEGSCACSAGTQLCDGECITPLTDPRHCGGCGVTCGFGEECCSGDCIPTSDSELSCGSCAATCGGGDLCVGTTCCAPAEACGPDRIDEDCNGLVDEGCPEQGLGQENRLDGLSCAVSGRGLTCPQHDPYYICNDYQSLPPEYEPYKRTVSAFCAADEFVVGIKAIGRHSMHNMGMEAICAPLELHREADDAEGVARYSVRHGTKTARFTFGAVRGEVPQNVEVGSRMCPEGEVVTAITLACTHLLEGFYLHCSSVSAEVSPGSGNITLHTGTQHNLDPTAQGSDPGDSGHYYSWCPSGTLARGFRGTYYHIDGGSFLDMVLNISTAYCATPVIVPSPGVPVLSATENVLDTTYDITTSSFSGSLHRGPKAVDGDPTTYFETAGSDVLPSWEVDLGQLHRVVGVDVDAEGAPGFLVELFLDPPGTAGRMPVASFERAPGAPNPHYDAITAVAQYMRIRATGDTLRLNEVRLNGWPNAALGAMATQSSLLEGGTEPVAGIDGVRQGGDLVETLPEEDPYYRIELDVPHAIDAVNLWGRGDPRAVELTDITVIVRDAAGEAIYARTIATGFPNPDAMVHFPEGIVGSQVEVRFANPASGILRSLSFAELEVVGSPSP